MAKIDIDRFICSLIKLNGFAGMYNLSNTRKALESQGLKYDSETDEIVSIEPEQEPSDGELTEFEKELADCIESGKLTITPSWEIAVQWSDVLIAVARKQIVNEIDVDNVNGFCYEKMKRQHEHGRYFEANSFGQECYRKGIQDTLDLIKKGEQL